METGQDVLAEASQGIQLTEVGNSVEEEQPSTLNTPNSISPLCSPAKLGPPPKRERKVSFPDDSSLVRSLEPYDPWKDAGNCTSKDVIDAYRKICNQLKVKPCEKLVKQLEACEDFNERINVIDLRGTKLDSRSCESLEEVLRKVRTKTLDLENTNLEDDGTLSILEMVEFYHSACKLNLAYNNKIRARGWQALGRTLKRTPCLEYLDVRHTVWTEQSIPLIGRSLRLNCPLTILHMEATNLSGRPLFLLANAIKANQMLKDLFLGDNKLVPSDGQCIGAMLKNNTTLRLLDLRNNGLQDMGLGHVCEGLGEQKQDGLQTLVLWNNQLTFQGMGYLSRALASLTNLQTLNLGHNRLTNEGIHNLKDGLLLNKSLQRLGLLNTRLTSEGIIALAEVIADSKILLRLDIRENDPYVGGLMALSLALKMNYSLVRIDLDKELKKEPGMETTQRCLLADIYGFCQRNKTMIENRASNLSLQTTDLPSPTEVSPSASNTNINPSTSIPKETTTPASKADNRIQLQATPPKPKFDLKGFGGFSSRFRITRIFETSPAETTPTTPTETSTPATVAVSTIPATPVTPSVATTLIVATTTNAATPLTAADIQSNSASQMDVVAPTYVGFSPPVDTLINVDEDVTNSASSSDESHEEEDILFCEDDINLCSSTKEDNLLVDIDQEPTPVVNITSELEKVNFQMFESDSSSSQDTDWENRMSNYACGSRDSVDSMGTPIAKSEKYPESNKEPTANFYEHELDAILSNNHVQESELTNNKHQNNDNFWMSDFNTVDSFNTTPAQNMPNVDPPTADLLGP